MPLEHRNIYHAAANDLFFYIAYFKLFIFEFYDKKYFQMEIKLIKPVIELILLENLQKSNLNKQEC